MSLAGKRIVNTRAIHQAAALDLLLRERGAIPLSYPCIAIAPSDDLAGLDEAARALADGGFDWLVLSSANTVVMLSERLAALGLTLAPVKAAAVGTATAQAAQTLLGLSVEAIPDDFSAEGLAQSLAITAGSRLLLPQSEIARPALAESLAGRGAAVTAVTAYRTVRGAGGVGLVPLLRRGDVDAVAFTSASTVRWFGERLQGEGGTLADLEGVCVACIGEQTSRAARSDNLIVSVQAQPHTLAAVVAALDAYYGDRAPE